MLTLRMTTPRLTQCPHCKATFKVTEEQLGIANGRVRCGACMNIFDAIAYSLDPAKNASTPAPATPTKPKPEPSADDLLLDDDDTLFADDPDEDKKAGGYSGGGFLSDELSDSFLALDDDDHDAFSDDVADKKPPRQQTASTVKLDSDESWANEMLEQLDQEPFDDALRAEREPRAGTTQTRGRQAQPDIKPATAFELEQPALFGAEPTTPKQSAPNDWFSTELDHANPFDRLTISEENIERRRSPWVSALLWLGCSALLLLLLAQASWFHYETLARYPAIATLYQKACAHIGCTLPALADINKIRSTNLIVRSHPTQPKTLIIEVVLSNEAGFEQPFPDLGFYFSDINNQIIAQRLIPPQEYLSGEMQSWTQFPPGQPIHVSLEIMDPGKEAVNYNLKFFPPKQHADASAAPQS